MEEALALVGVICIPRVRLPGQLEATQTQQHDQSRGGRDAQLLWDLCYVCKHFGLFVPNSSYHSRGQSVSGVVWQGVVWQGVVWLPEALWLSFQPAPAAVDQASWRLHKLGSLISLMEVRCLLRRHWLLWVSFLFRACGCQAS
jgi:hypothetical protein